MAVQWKHVTNYEEYLVSNTGLIKSLKTNKLMSINNLRGGYRSLQMNADTLKVHIIVAKEFIPNDDPLKNIVNHIDADRLNNNVSNLEWVTIAENNRHGYIVGNNHTTKRAVLQLTEEGETIRHFESFKEASESTGVDSGSIANVCKGKVHHAGGYRWKFAFANPNELHDNPPDMTNFVQIKGFPNHQISKEGTIYSTRFKKLMKIQINADGYKIVSLANNNNKKTFLVHRLVAEHYIPKIKGKDFVNHIDSNKLNSNVDNLEWMTNSENMIHAHNHKKEKQLEIKKLQTPKLVVKATNGPGEKSGVEEKRLKD
jgi:hypothetical protein